MPFFQWVESASCAGHSGHSCSAVSCVECCWLLISAPASQGAFQAAALSHTCEFHVGRFSSTNQRQILPRKVQLSIMRQIRTENAVTLDRQKNGRRPPLITYLLPLYKILVLGLLGEELLSALSVVNTPMWEVMLTLSSVNQRCVHVHLLSNLIWWENDASSSQSHPFTPIYFPYVHCVSAPKQSLATSCNPGDHFHFPPVITPGEISSPPVDTDDVMDVME